MEWRPIAEDRIWELMNSARTRMNPLERRFWDAIRIDPEKWTQHPYGDIGGGFWAVALLGRRVVWFNDIENGFNWSNYRDYGSIPEEEYRCNQDRLESTIRELMNIVTTGYGIGGRAGPPIPGEFPAL